jgi:HD-GYP domain-containing protein (c-di-GMP phosphodiesterase class II)
MTKRILGLGELLQDHYVEYNELETIGVMKAHSLLLPHEDIHSLMVAELLREMAKKLPNLTGENLSGAEICIMCFLGRYHDIGKVGIDPELRIMNKVLVPGEYTEMKNHPEYGIRILMHDKLISDKLGSYLVDVAYGILCHQERFNGEGYPFGLLGSDIPIYAREVALADGTVSIGREYNENGDISFEDYKKNMIEHEECYDPELLGFFLDEVFTYEVFKRIFRKNLIKAYCDSDLD